MYESSRDPETGKLTFKGNPIKHRKGQPYLVDCNVTGSDNGTPTDPKFSLLSLWDITLTPSIEALVAPDGPCTGATVVFQEDNAGPHNCSVYRKFMVEEFSKRGWKIELQAPQGPYTNVLDLSVFPMMSKRHSEKLQMYCNSEADKKRVWNTAVSVWKETSSAEIGQAFILAYRVLAQIIKEEGNNAWLAAGTPHCNVRNEYTRTNTGVRPKVHVQ